MQSEATEQYIKERIAELEGEKRDAERRVQVAQDAVTDKEQRLANWRGALRDYRESNDLPDEVEHCQVLADEYATMGPTQMVDHWASQHGGEVVVKELSQAVLRARAYTLYSTAYNTIRGTVRRRKDFKKVAPGRYQSTRTAHGERLQPRPATNRVGGLGGG